MPETRALTLMFYFASDNSLAPLIVPQLKALKQAGFHPEANVVVHFDSNDNTPAHIFDVNRVNKIRAKGQHRFGFSPNPPFVRSLVEDKLWSKPKREIIRTALKKELGEMGTNYVPPDMPRKMSGEQNPKHGLQAFLEFCRTHYPARHYMLFLLGHGLVMGNNMFLLDEHALEPSLSLRDFAAVLRTFKLRLDEQKAHLELVSFHSCSMSALEVAYELQGTAKYMLAAQGSPFVGSWPYAEILLGIFNKIGRLLAAGNRTAKKNGGCPTADNKESPAKIINELVKEIWSSCYLNTYDFHLAGYSFDLCLCDLTKVQEIEIPLKELSSVLIKGLANPVVNERILLAHWDAQSYWQDRYTDLYDFCFRLNKRCEDAKLAHEKTRAILRSIQKKCDQVIRVLTSGDDNLILRSDFTGPEHQYSHGLFVFFPWSEPSNKQFWLKEYASYKFKKTSWRKFLERYFLSTIRQPRGYEHHLSKGGGEYKTGLDEMLLENIPDRNFNCEAQLGKGEFMNAKQQSSKDGFWPFNDWPPKETATLGDRSAYSSIKNYSSSFTRAPIVEAGKSERRTSVRKRVTGKNAR